MMDSDLKPFYELFSTPRYKLGKIEPFVIEDITITGKE